MATPDLIEQYRVMHRAGHFPGHSMLKHLLKIETLVDETNASTLLDYGSGKGVQWEHPDTERLRRKLKERGGFFWLYDPAISPHDIRPVSSFDVVISTDVAEHIPEDGVPAYLQDVFRYAKKAVFLSICTRPAKKTLPDGRNCHLTIQTPDWWLARIDDANSGLVRVETEFVT